MVSVARRGGRAGLDVPIGRLSPSTAELVEGIYLRHYRDVYRYVLALTKSGDEAEDVTAQTFERALVKWSVAPESPLPWLLVTARRIAMDRWRRARRLARLTFGPRRSARADPGTQRTEFWIWFHALASALTARQREVLVLRYQHDLDDRAIGVIMGLSESGVRSLTARALETLRAHPELTR